MNNQMTQAERLATYQAAIDGFTQQIHDVTSGKLDIRMRGPDGAYTPMSVAAEVDYLNKRIAIMQDALDLARTTHPDPTPGLPLKSPAANGDGQLFYESPNGDSWLLVTDAGQRRFVRHVPNAASGGDIDVVELEAFRLHAPHSPQNAGLETLLAARAH